MKANYTKPLLAVEMFSLAQSATRDCADNLMPEQVTFNDINTCFVDMGGGFTVFVGGKTCQFDGEQMGYLCYNNPTEGQYIFRS